MAETDKCGRSKEGVSERWDGAADWVTGAQLMGRRGKTRGETECKAGSATEMSWYLQMQKGF